MRKGTAREKKQTHWKVGEKKDDNNNIEMKIWWFEGETMKGGKGSNVKRGEGRKQKEERKRESM